MTAPKSDGWLQDNVVHPFVNGTGLIQIYDTLAGKPAAVENVTPAKTFSADWCVQSLSSAAGAILPFVVSGKLTGMGMRAAGEGFGMTGTWAKIMASESVAQVAGAGLYQFAEKPLDGQTRLGSAVGTMAGFAFFSGGNALVDRTAPLFSSSIGRFGAQSAMRFATGAVGGLGSYETNNFVDRLQGVEHQETWDQRLQSMAQGGFVNFALPVVQEGASKVLDHTVYSQPWSKGMPVSRDVKNNQVADEEVLSLARENPLARVKRGADVDTSADTANNVVKINSLDGPEKLAHELTHLSLAHQSEPFYEQIAGLAKTAPESAEQAFMGLRAHMESAARQSENRVGTNQSGDEFVKAVDDPKAIGETVAANGKTYNQNWQAEWQQFSKDQSYRPEIEYSGRVPNIVKWTHKYEKWMSDHIKIVPEDLAKKHADMASDPFLFLRATYYRWAKMFPEVLPKLNDAPVVRSVGDLHTGNFGSWLNRVGRLIWGINDFDEAHPLPYTNDLVRLLTSANFMRQAGDLHISLEDACNRVLDGYKQGLKDGGKPFNLDKGNRKLADIARSQMPKADAYWAKLKGQFTALDDDTTIPKAALKALDSRLPNQHGPVEQGRRQAGEGSLGRERFVEMTTARGSDLAAEVKAFLPSAYYFAKGKEGGKSYYNNTVDHAVRSKDPYLGVHDGWVARRLAPKNAKIDLAELADIKDERRLLYAMGYETANVHLGTKGAAKAVLADLDKREEDWLYDATKKMTKSTLADQADWKKHMDKQGQ